MSLLPLPIPILLPLPNPNPGVNFIHYELKKKCKAD